MKTSQRARQYFLFFIDILVLFVALFATLWLRRGLGEAVASFGVHARYFALIYAVLLGIYYVAGFYDLQTDFDDARFLGKIIWTSLVDSLVGALYFYLVRDAPIGPKTVLALDAIMTAFFVWIWRAAYSRIARRLNSNTKIAFVGSDPALKDLVADIQPIPTATKPWPSTTRAALSRPSKAFASFATPSPSSGWRRAWTSASWSYRTSGP